MERCSNHTHASLPETFRAKQLLTQFYLSLSVPAIEKWVLIDHTQHTIYVLFTQLFHQQNGICLQKYNFWSNNDDENYLEKPFRNLSMRNFIKVKIFAQNHKSQNSVTKITIFTHSRRQNLFHHHLGQKIVVFDTDSILITEKMYESNSYIVC